MLTSRVRQERGQAVVLLAFALIGLLGFAAVALDGGNIYTEQRRAQSAADNAVMAAAYQYMSVVTSTGVLSSTALANASLNGYDNNGSSNTVTFHRPPVIGPYVGDPSYMQVVITERVPTALAHLVYKGPFQLTVSAVARGRYGGPPVDGNAIVSLNKTGCGVVKSNGNGSLDVTGGGVFSNSDGSACSTYVVDAAGNGSSIVVHGDYDISVVATTDSAGGVGTILPWPVKSGADPVPSDPLSDLDPPDCGANKGAAPSSGSVNPGTYTTIRATGNVTLKPGLYCVTDDSAHAVEIVNQNASLVGTGVMIYMAAGGMSIQQGILNLKAPSTTYNPECASIMPWDAPNTSVCHYLGMVIYVDRNNDSKIVLQGHTGWGIEGTIYAPSSLVQLDGNADWTMTGQVLSDAVGSGGGGAMYVVYNPDTIYIPAPSVSLMQ